MVWYLKPLTIKLSWFCCLSVIQDTKDEDKLYKDQGNDTGFSCKAATSISFWWFWQRVCLYRTCLGAYHFKLLGISISHDMNSQAHIDAIFRKAASRLHFFRILKKSGLKPYHLLHFYLTLIILPVLQYCSVVWRHCLTKAQSETLEVIQRRALRII